MTGTSAGVTVAPRRSSVLLAAWVAAGCAGQPDMGFSPAPADYWQRVGPGSIGEVVESQLRRQRTDGVVVAVVVGDSVTFLEAFGSVPASDAPLPDTARFQTAAAMPLVNALAAAQLAQHGELELGAPVARWAPDTSAPHDSVTLAQLLTHTAGLTAVPAVAGRTGEDELGEQVHYLNRRDRLTEPGAIYSRSGPGVALAGWVMGRAHGASYPETLDDAVFSPLGMGRTSARHPGAALLQRRAVRPGEPASPELEAPRYEPVPPESALAGPVRGLYATVPDLARLVRALLNRGVVDGEERLPPGAVAAALEPRTATPVGDPVAMAGVWRRWEGRRLLELADDRPGHNALLSLLPDQGIGVAMASTGHLGDLARLPDWIFRRLLGFPGRSWPPPERPRPEPAPPPIHPLDAVGEYWNGGERIVLAAPDGMALKLASGPWVLDVEWRRDAFHAVLPDGRSALRFQLVRGGDGRLYMWLQDRALRRDNRR